MRGIKDQEVEVEGDLVIVIGWMHRGKGGPWKLSHTIKEAVFLVSSLNISFKWIPREGNEMADRLTKRGVEKNSIFVGSPEEETLT